MERLKRLKEMRWEFGVILPADIRSSLSSEESEWYTTYCSNLSEFMGRLNDGRGVDLSMYKKPPKSLYVKVNMSKSNDFSSNNYLLRSDVLLIMVILN